MSDIEIESELVGFIASVKKSDTLWGLGDNDGGFVVCDSNHVEGSEALLLWDSREKAVAQANDEWQGYTPVAIPVAEFLEFWVDDLSEDKALVGLNWNDEQVCVEIEPQGLARALED